MKARAGRKRIQEETGGDKKKSESKTGYTRACHPLFKIQESCQGTTAPQHSQVAGTRGAKPSRQKSEKTLILGEKNKYVKKREELEVRKGAGRGRCWAVSPKES